MPPAEDVHGTARGPQEAVADSPAVSVPDGPAPDKTAGRRTGWPDKSGPRRAPAPGGGAQSGRAGRSRLGGSQGAGGAAAAGQDEFRSAATSPATT